MNLTMGRGNSDNVEDKSKYWFTRDKMDKIIKVHDYLDYCQKSKKLYLLGQS